MQFQAILTSIALVAGLMLPHASAVAASKVKPRPQTADDAVILDMNQAFKKGDRKRLSALLPQVQGHVLEPWGAYWELAARLDEAGPTEIRTFLSRYAGTYQEDRLRNDWLLLLGKRRDWATFSAEYPKFRMNDDRSVRCYALLNEAQNSGADVAAQVQDLWLAQKEADEGCAAAADQQLETGKLKAHTAWLRARLGFENERPRIAAQAVGLLNPDWVDSVNAVYANPVRFLDDKITALRPRTKELVTLALVRLASTDTTAAMDEMNKVRWRTQLTQEERSWVWGVIGKRAARRLTEGAINYFSHAQDQHLNGDHLTWKVRAALRAGAWQEVLNATAAMPEAQRQDPAWVYWRGRALLALAGKPDAPAQARALFESIASPRGFYEQLAQEELGRPITVPPKPEPLTAAEKEAAQANPGLRRALYAIQAGLRAEGVREWNYSVGAHQRGGLSDRELLAAAQLACDNQVWDRCINTSERTKTVIDFEQRFPMPFKNAVVQRAGQIDLDPAYVYGLIRQESRFIMDAQSSVGASGLMQVMPATARWTAKRIGLTDFKPQQITDRDTNIAIGTGYLKLVLDSFDGSMPLAAAAYNAGPSRSRAWRGQDGDPMLEAAIWAENVPFNETRDYVKKVLSNTTNYAALITGRPQSLKARLGQVGPQRPGKSDTYEDLP
ncbi:MAG: lytic transglycosylase [Curvibacter sp. PD_MW3]|nr:MAG: lytic transglycosylase [Curvibacter sp. PD_MW3]